MSRQALSNLQRLPRHSERLRYRQRNSQYPLCFQTVNLYNQVQIKHRAHSLGPTPPASEALAVAGRPGGRVVTCIAGSRVHYWDTDPQF